jgi:hypothetical protein
MYMPISSRLRDVQVQEVEDSFLRLTTATLKRGLASDPPVELFDIFARFPLIDEISDNVATCGIARGFGEGYSRFYGNGGRMPLGALALYDEAHSLGLFASVNSLEIADSSVSVFNKGVDEIVRISSAYPVVNRLIDLALIDAGKLGAPNELVGILGQGVAHSLGVLVDFAERA